MARLKNALRVHEVQEYVKGAEPTEEGWLELAHYIRDISDATDEATDEEAFYSGDGTTEETVTGVAGAYDVEGDYDPEDEAQELIASMKYKKGEGRYIWHRITRADGKKQWTGQASALNIVAGSGEAAGYEEFGCTLRFNEEPKEVDIETLPEG